MSAEQQILIEKKRIIAEASLDNNQGLSFETRAIASVIDRMQRDIAALESGKLNVIAAKGYIKKYPDEA